MEFSTNNLANSSAFPLKFWGSVEILLATSEYQVYPLHLLEVLYKSDRLEQYTVEVKGHGLINECLLRKCIWQYSAENGDRKYES